MLFRSIKSCVFHYELEFIHPFADGNGRMGRLWQTILLMYQYPIFEFLPIETIIKKRQTDYYKVLARSDNSGHCNAFIEFMLQVLETALEELLSIQTFTLTSADRIILFKTINSKQYFTRQDYLRVFKEISAATASRDLQEAVIKKIIIKKGDKRTSIYRFI